MLVMCNPYHALDAKGRLAGAFPEPEKVRAGTAAPLRRHVCASRVMVDGSYRKPDPTGLIPAQADVYWAFSSMPIEVFAEGALEHAYLHAFRHEEIFSCENGAPIQKLAKARLQAISGHLAAYGTAPDTSTWFEQFELDAKVVEACEGLIAETEQARAKASEADKSALAKAAEEQKTAVATAKKRAEERNAARERDAALMKRIVGAGVAAPTKKIAPSSSEPGKE